jgi:hypothetical protein
VLAADAWDDQQLDRIIARTERRAKQLIETLDGLA